MKYNAERDTRRRKDEQNKKIEDTKADLDRMLSEYKKGNAPAAAGAGSMTGAAIGSSAK